MAQYIEKSAVVAEINRRIEALHSTLNERETAVKFGLKDFLSFIGTIDVKEINMPALDNGNMPIERWHEAVQAAVNQSNYRKSQGFTETCDDFFVDGVQWADEHPVEAKEIKLPNPRFPHLNNIVDKVFGIGNLESLEYEEAEQLVLLAKEELLKDLEVKEVDLEKEIDSQWKDCTPVDEGMGSEFANIAVEQFANIAKYFFNLGLNARKED